jgi:hypothetical protein
MEAHGAVDCAPVDDDAAMLFEIDLAERSWDRQRLGPKLKGPLALSSDRGFAVFVSLVFFDSRTSLLFGADLRPRLPCPIKSAINSIAPGKSRPSISWMSVMMSPLPQVHIQRLFGSSQRQEGSSSLCPGIGQWI